MKARRQRSEAAPVAGQAAGWRETENATSSQGEQKDDSKGNERKHKEAKGKHRQKKKENTRKRNETSTLQTLPITAWHNMVHFILTLGIVA